MIQNSYQIQHNAKKLVIILQDSHRFFASKQNCENYELQLEKVLERFLITSASLSPFTTSQIQYAHNKLCPQLPYIINEMQKINIVEMNIEEISQLQSPPPIQIAKSFKQQNKFCFFIGSKGNLI
eukprot:TRINITY_DN5428_c1_g1_i4.p2 TRINITY_DN5428_c1_g1~~TRINITY_DN5428_c1_g1_i4.p2  ORF type:complete len:125 (-),score=0.87 TRINITY_DN5428_c1_g1_i4:342-716(-)